MVTASLLAVLVIVASVAVWIVRGARDYYALSPGTAPEVSASTQCHSIGGGDYALASGQPCIRLVLPASKTHPVDGSILMVDVLVGQSTPWQFLLSKLGLLGTFYDGTVLEPNGAILGTTPASQLGCQNDQEMSGATSYASVVALRRLGYTVAENDLGAQIFQVSPRTPAAAAGVECSDVITAVDGAAVHTSADLVKYIQSKAPGDVVHLTASRGGKGGTQTVHLNATLSGTPAVDGQPADPNRAFLGVATQTDTTYTFPFDVNIQVGSIGGPSAGLAMTLGLLDSLSGGHLTGGHRIAATGTIDLQGEVGDVGGVAQKTVAVRRAGAQAFFVPVQEYQTARREAGKMRVYAVSTLDQALSDLQALGGQVPSGSTTSTGGRS